VEHDDYDVLAEDGVVVGRIFKVHAAPVGTPWMWTLGFGQHKDAAMTAFAKSWRRNRGGAHSQTVTSGWDWPETN
jgi:hypothetical protein